MNLFLRLLVVIALASALAFPQGEAPVQKPDSTPARPDDTPKEQQKPADRTKKLTPEQAQELFASIQKLLGFVSQSTGLRLKGEVKREIYNEVQVRQHMEKMLATDKETKRREQAELVAKKWGLLPRDFETRTFVIKLLGEVVAGFYDYRTKKIYLLDWVEPDSQKAILAHELTHAVQDQNRDLEKWMDEARKTGERSRNDETSPGLVDSDELLSARSAVAEGQGMVVFVDYLLSQGGRSLADSPQVIEVVRTSMKQQPDTPLLKEAPLVLREGLIFPYYYGLGFVHQLLVSGGKPKAFAGALQDPPRNTHHVMFPETYLRGDNVAPMRLPRMKDIHGAAYRRLDAGSIGQFDIELFMKQYADEKTAALVMPGWRGGVYYAAIRKNAARAKATRADVALVYASRWESPEAAQGFVSGYVRGLTQRYQKVEAPDATANDSARFRWTTDEGPVFIERMGEQVVITEGFEDAVFAKVRASVASGATEAQGERRVEELNEGEELSLRLVPRGASALIAPWVRRAAEEALRQAGNR